VSASPETELGSFDLRIDSLAHGGDGVGRLDGRVVFVPRTAPGDRIRAERTSEGKRELRARVVELIEPGAGRVAPPCPHYERCGGCQWQHLDMETQLSAKRATLHETIARLGRVPRDEVPSIETLPSPQPWRYRRRARFHVGENGHLGYIGRDGREVVELSSCHLLSDGLEAMVLSVSRAMASWASRSQVRTVEICEAAGRGALWLEMDDLDKDPRAATAALLGQLPAISGAVVQQGERWTEVGEVTLADGDGFIRPDSFAQANRAASERLVARALESLSPLMTDRALELYCGDGNFTLPLASRVREVMTVDREGKSLALLRRRAKRNGVSNLSILAEDVERVVPRLRSGGQRFEVALLDPPRAGAKAIMEALAFLVTRRIAYVSCDPATLARDVGTLYGQGYRLTGLAMSDLFPQTYHLEAVATLERVRDSS
jgi:23S rRNA (uracil1939-C5)-methyltransferase